MVRLLSCIALTLSLTGCAQTLDHSRAKSDSYIGMELELESGQADYDELLNLELEALTAMGYEVEITPGKERAITFYSTIILPEDFAQRTDLNKLILIRHERVHAEQWRGMGVLVFGIAYAQERDRWALEMQGYRRMIRDRVSAGQDDAEIKAWIKALAKKFPKSYDISPKLSAEVSRATKQILLEELDFARTL